MVTEDRDLCTPKELELLQIVGEKMLFLPPEFEGIYVTKPPGSKER